VSSPCATWLRRGALLAALLAASACRRDAEAAEVPLAALADVESEVVAAITAAREDVRCQPTSGKAWGRLGDQYFVNDFTLQAAECYARAEALDPQSFLWPFRRGLSLLQDHPELAAESLERSLASLDGYAAAHEIYAGVLVRLGRSDEAIEHYLRATELDRRRPDSETGLGLIFLARGEFETARTHLEAALARDPKHVETHVALAQVCLALGQDRKAQRHAELSRTLPQHGQEWDALATPDVPPTGARARTRFAKSLAERGQAQEAVEQFRAALRSNPDYYPARSSLANLLAEQGRRDEAIELLRENERRNPSFAEVRRDLARLTGARPAEGGDE